MSERYFNTFLSEENMLNYAKACIDLAIDLPDYRDRKNFDTILIPSRGAVPILLGTLHALEKLGNISENHAFFNSNLVAPPIIKGLLPENSGLETKLKEMPTQLLLCPFTADLNINKYNPELDNNEFTDKTRKYWTYFTAALFEKPQKRQKDPYFKSFVDLILRSIENRDYIAEFYEKFPQIKRLAMIDTVISGRAAYTILKSFEEISHERKKDFNPTAFLVVDKNGKRLKRDYYVPLNIKKANNQVEFYYMPNIISEDKGASLEGVAAILYPSVMESSKALTFENEQFFIGAGSWQSLNSGESYKKHFKKFINTIYTAIDAQFCREFCDSVQQEKSLERFEEERQDLVNYFVEKNVLSKYSDGLNHLNLSQNIKIKQDYETSSHVVHLVLENKIEKHLLSDFVKNNPIVKYKLNKS